MNPVLENLVVLQSQDLELQRLRAELAEVPRRVALAETARAAAEKHVVELRAALAGEERLRREQEREIAGHRAKIDRLRRSLDSATSEAQVTAFGHEIGFAKAAAERLEEDELASLERTDALEMRLAEAAEASAGKQSELEAERARGARVTGENMALRDGLERQRGELRAEIDETWLASYDRLSRAKGTAVSEALGNATAGRCATCQMGVRPQRWQDLIGREHEGEIFTCESCGRLLFWDPRRDTPRAWEAGDRLRSAQAATAAGKGSTQLPASRSEGRR